MNERGFDNLRTAVVEQCAKDYLKALHRVKATARAVMHGKKLNADAKHRLSQHMVMIHECEEFFENDIDNWVDLDGGYLRRKLLKQSGMDRQLLELLKEAYKKEDKNNDGETGDGI